MPLLSIGSHAKSIVAAATIRIMKIPLVIYLVLFSFLSTGTVADVNYFKVAPILIGMDISPQAIPSIESCYAFAMLTI